jgi:Rrf2 family nitric oxide-sensitive transcriptional repressor
MISRTAEYALRAVVHLAAVADGDSPSRTVGQIAAATRVPEGYLAKVLQALTRAGVIASQRGLGGGFRLVKTARDTSLYEVVQAVDPFQRIRDCPLGLDAHGKNLCPLHKRLDDAMLLIEEQFRATTIAELLEETVPSEHLASLEHSQEELCSFPLIPLRSAISGGGPDHRLSKT